MSKEYRDLEDIKKEIMDATSGGLDIFYELYPHASTKRNFKIREENTASASLHQNKQDGNWILHDFGSSEKPMNAISAFAKEHNLDWVKACVELARQYNIQTQMTWEEPKPTFKEYTLSDFPHELDEDGYFFETTDEFSDAELRILGPFVDADTCKKCNCYKVISIASVVKDKRTGAKKILQRFSNDNFPIFAFINKHNGKTFKKIYQPRSAEKKYKFMFIGGRPKGFINGMQRVSETYGKLLDEWKDKKQQAENNNQHFDEAEPEKLENVVICSGERDALNMTSLGFFCVWHNSETAEWSKNDIKKLYANAQAIINIPDLDETGVTQGKALAESFLTIKTLWLPQWLLKRRDARGSSCKDLTDYVNTKRRLSKKDVVADLKRKVDAAMELQFWESTATDKGIRWSLSNVLINNFLHHFGFYRYEMPGSKQGWVFVHVKDHLVEQVEPQDLLRFIDDFLEKRNAARKLRDLAINTTNLAESKLARIKPIELNFKNFSKDFQTFSFSHEAWIVTKSGIEVTNSQKSNYVWEHDVIDKKIQRLRDIEIETDKIKILPNFFNIKNDNGIWDIEILEKDCDFLNFVINISRVYWKDEYINAWQEKADTIEEIYALEENAEYRSLNKFNIEGPLLNPTQIAEQKLHLINKIYVIGYLMHAYKDEANGLLVYLMENDMIEDGISNGGSGKSLFAKAFNELVETINRPGANKEIFTDKFVYDGVTENTRVFIFDDADKYLNPRDLYAQVTGDLYVNPKNGTAFSLPYKQSPKFIVTSNFGLRNTEGSTIRRLLISATSNYYHVKEENELPGRVPPDDFNGRRFFQDWDADQYNKFINFYLQCLVFYLNCEGKIDPPMNSIAKRNLQAQINKHFMDFADKFFLENPPNAEGMVEYNKMTLLEELQNYNSNIKGITSTGMANNFKAYCQLHGYEYMPGRSRYQKSIDGVTVDYIMIYVGKPKSEEDIDFIF